MLRDTKVYAYSFYDLHAADGAVRYSLELTNPIFVYNKIRRIYPN